MRIIFVVLSALIAGCVASGPSYIEVKNTLPNINKENSRIVVFRTKESELLFSTYAPISLGNVEIGKVGYGSFIFHDLSKGQYNLSTRLLEAPGSCSVDFSIDETGKTYYFEVRPRREANEAFKKGMKFGSPYESGMSALAEESRGKKCGGLFSINPISPKEAISKLEAKKN